MAIIRAQFQMQGATLIPEDRFVNTFYVDTFEDSLAVSAPLIAGELDTFYNVDVPGAVVPTAVVGGLSPFIVVNAEVRCYDMADPEPRIPVVVPVTMGNRNSQGLPEEVALCLSIRGEPPITARRRGRLYIGPLGTIVAANAISSTPGRPQDSFRETLCGAAERLRDNLILNHDYRWVIRSSRPTVNYVEVAGGWVDNAWDTQRRRGPEPSSRINWPTTP